MSRRARHAGQPKSTLAERYVYEGLRMDDHPGIRFVDGTLGRRPAVLGTGLDVWEIVETIRANDDSIVEGHRRLHRSRPRDRRARGSHLVSALDALLRAHREEDTAVAAGGEPWLAEPG